MTRQAFVCATPFQIFNSLHIALAGEHDDSLRDIYVVAGFTGADETAARLRECGVFDEVVLVESGLDAYGLGSKREDPAGMGRTKEALRRRAESDFPTMIEKDRYDEVLFSLPTLTAEILCEANGRAKITMFDDGYGSYFFDILANSGWGGRYSTYPGKMMLWAPGMAKTATHGFPDPMPVPRGKERLRDLLNGIFAYGEHGDIEVGEGKRRAYYMSQPIAEIQKSEGAEDRLREVLEGVSDSFDGFVVKPHPRDTPESVVSVEGAIFDGRGHAVELLVANGEFSEDDLLIGMFSTAQYVPAMIYGIYPKCLFLHHIMLEDESEIARIDGLVDYVRGIYGGKQDRLCVAKSVEDAIAFGREC